MVLTLAERCDNIFALWSNEETYINFSSKNIYSDTQLIFINNTSMKLVDKLIRHWRVRVALARAPREMLSAFDIGCDDGFLLKKLGDAVLRKDGVDPRLDPELRIDGATLRKGYFPQAVVEQGILGTYDAIFALAVFEHFTQSDIDASAATIARMLSPKGRLIVTVPHPFVDRILDVLKFLHLVDGQAMEEHHGFDPGELVMAFSKTLILVKHQRFQFGLNNVFIFEGK